MVLCLSNKIELTGQDIRTYTTIISFFRTCPVHSAPYLFYRSYNQPVTAVCAGFLPRILLTSQQKLNLLITKWTAAKSNVEYIWNPQ